MQRRFAKKRVKSEAMELDITSLLDILVILLVFLLKSYNASNLKLDLVDTLQMPDSKARELGSHAIIVQVDKFKQIWIENKKIATIDGSKEIKPLYNYLQNKREIASANESPVKEKSINLVLDKKLPYKNMQQIMHTSSLAGYSEFKFIVQGDF